MPIFSSKARIDCWRDGRPHTSRYMPYHQVIAEDTIAARIAIANQLAVEGKETALQTYNDKLEDWETVYRRVEPADVIAIQRVAS